MVLGEVGGYLNSKSKKDNTIKFKPHVREKSIKM